MTTTPSPDRRFIVALVAAVASATLAVGATAGALLGWIGPTTAATEPGGSAPAGAGSSQIIYVPITRTAPSIEPPTAREPRFAMVEPGSLPDDRDDRDERHDRHDRDHRDERDHEEGDDD